jgi:hypothetical protein
MAWKSLVLVLNLSFLSPGILFAQGKVYLVLGSDTATWDGMDTNKFHCTYSIALFTDPGQNAYKVMDPSYRSKYVDSYGQTIKFTWWMMGGNIFRYATNKDMPVPNTMTLYAMKKYHGAAIARFGDEITMHYHTFVWTDYDKDGIYWWNQAHNFTESSQDFDYTLAQYLLEEGTFPVSFRSGWHAMDNEWQRYLDNLLPFSMHDDYPSVRSDTIEPIDNVYDWSKSSKEYIPFHPSPDNYQLAGSCRGWNLRSTYMASMDSTTMKSIFAKAAAGVDQVVCLWAHLPETDFPDNASRIDFLAHIAAAQYPTVKFRYCTAVEAMQRWLGTTDVTPPTVAINENRVGENSTYVITTNEPLFQPQPFVAMKDIYERYSVPLLKQTGSNEWTTAVPIPSKIVAKVAAAATDLSGNLGISAFRPLPDDQYIDNKDSAYTETAGTWTLAPRCAWGTDARMAMLGQTDSAKVQWKPSITQSCRYNFFVQVPSVSNSAGKTTFRILNKGQVVQTSYFANPITSGDWVYVGTAQLDATGPTVVEMVVKGDTQAGKVVPADVLKISALVRERQIVAGSTSLDFGEVSETDTARASISVSNFGTQSATITSIRSSSSSVFSYSTVPITIGPMQSAVLSLGFGSTKRGSVSDTLVITSDDPLSPNLLIPVTAKVVSYFLVVDNDDTTKYREVGKWNFSNAQAYGPTSRYASLSDGPGNSAYFMTTLKKTGIYDIQIIVPKTVNASTKARYVLRIGSSLADSTFIDQNNGSGGWVTILSRSLPAALSISVVVSDVSYSTVAGIVLRADAMRFSLQQEVTSAERSVTAGLPESFVLQRNYPNPFNPSTRISFALPKSGYATLRVFDLLGREVANLFDRMAEPGWYDVNFNASNLSSGIYLYRLESAGSVISKKMVLLK